MRLRKSLQLAWNILVHSKLRSWLTIIGIVIGIAAIVSIVSISEGAQQQMAARFGDLGADIITVSPGFSRASGFMRFRDDDGGSSRVSTTQKNLTGKDVTVIKTLSNVKTVMGTVSARGEVNYLGKSGELSITGVDTTVWSDIVTDKVGTGRYLTSSDSYSVILGYNRANTYFEKTVQINRQIAIEGRIFKVVGIFAEGENDNAIIIPIKVARDILEGVGDKKIDSITVKVEDVGLVDDTIAAIDKKLMMSRGILREDKKDFSISSVKELQQTISDTLNTMALFLGSIAAISLVVGGIGITNTMFTSVLEKTRDIGVMKSIGARNRDIMLVFLFNSGMIGLVGGIGGVVLGSIASGAIGNAATAGGAVGGGGMGRIFGATAITPELLIFAFLFSIIVGMIAGVIPAYQASRMRPVDALRYE